MGGHTEAKCGDSNEHGQLFVLVWHKTWHFFPQLIEDRNNLLLTFITQRIDTSCSLPTLQLDWPTVDVPFLYLPVRRTSGHLAGTGCTKPEMEKKSFLLRENFCWREKWWHISIKNRFLTCLQVHCVVSIDQQIDHQHVSRVKQRHRYKQWERTSILWHMHTHIHIHTYRYRH